MENKLPFSEQSQKEQKVRLVLDHIHRAMMHHAMWFAEVQHQYGREKAREIMKNVYERTYDIQIRRLAKVLGFELTEGLPSPLMEMPDEKLDAFTEAVGVNWLANDGVWFQAVEFDKGMFDAKRCNDSCWAQFSPFEAWSVKRLLGLGENPGLDGLKLALQYRLYATVNKQSFAEETEDSFVFRMNECRVQVARKRKGLDDYPCKSGGLIEYASFAETIDSRIKTECIACPPDPHPEEYFCAWKFSLAGNSK
jgi:hypothetical protein